MLIGKCRLFVVPVVLSSCMTTVGVRAQSTSPLVQRSSLVYLGSFKVPSGIHSGGHANAGFEYGGTALAFNPLRNSLFLVGHDWDQFTAEISIPSLGGTATLLQPLVDASEGKNVGAGTTKVGGNLVYNGKLYFTKYLYYDASGSQTLSHFIRPLDLSVKGQVMGPFRVGSLGAGFYSGYFGLIPAEWQSALGGPVLTANCCLSIISRTSFGPAAFAIDPANIGVTQNAAPLVYYPSHHPTLARYHGPANPYWTASTIGSLVWCFPRAPLASFSLGAMASVIPVTEKALTTRLWVESLSQGSMVSSTATTLLQAAQRESTHSRTATTYGRTTLTILQRCTRAAKIPGTSSRTRPGRSTSQARTPTEANFWVARLTIRQLGASMSVRCMATSTTGRSFMYLPSRSGTTSPSPGSDAKIPR